MSASRLLGVLAVLCAASAGRAATGTEAPGGTEASSRQGDPLGPDVEDSAQAASSVAPLTSPPEPGGAASTAADAVAAPSPSTSSADLVAADPQPGIGPAATPAVDPRRHIVGLALDVGFPDFGSLTLHYRPFPFLRFGGSFLYNYVGYGLRGGVAVLPYFALAPSLNLEVGHFFESDARSEVKRFADVGPEYEPLLERFGYTFVNLQLGLEIGHPNWLVFYVRAGLSRVWMTVHGMQEAAAASTGEATKVTLGDASVRLGLPSVKLGFLVYFF